MSKGITVIPCGASSTAARTRPRLYERRRRLPAIPRNVTAGRELAGCIDEPPPVWGSQGTLAIMTLDVGLFLAGFPDPIIEIAHRLRAHASRTPCARCWSADGSPRGGQSRLAMVETSASLPAASASV